MRHCTGINKLTGGIYRPDTCTYYTGFIPEAALQITEEKSELFNTGGGHSCATAEIKLDPYIISYVNIICG